jgi:hypothetical protein
MKLFRSRFIIGASPSPATAESLRESGGFAADTELSMQVFEVRIDKTIRYCAWAGGKLVPDPQGFNGHAPHLTPAGQGAAEALVRLPHLYDDTGEPLYSLVFQGIGLGKTPLDRKIAAAFRMSRDINAIIVFVGDLAKELDGHVFKTMNVVGMVNVEDIRGMNRPGEGKR